MIERLRVAFAPQPVQGDIEYPEEEEEVEDGDEERQRLRGVPPQHNGGIPPGEDEQDDAIGESDNED